MTQKGGMGKTTLTMLAGVHLYYQGYRVLLIDADSPQHSLSVAQLSESRKIFGSPKLTEAFEKLPLPPIEITTIELSRLNDILPKLKVSGEYDYIFVDVTGTLNMEGLEDLSQCLDYVFVPMEMDVKSFVSGNQTVDYFHSLNSNIKLFTYWNRIKKGESVAIMNMVNEETHKKGIARNLKTILYDSVLLKRSVSAYFPSSQREFLEFMNELADNRIGQFTELLPPEEKKSQAIELQTAQ